MIERVGLDRGLIGLRVAHPDLEGPGPHFEPADLGRAQLGLEALGLGPHDAHELGAHDALDEAGVVLDLGRQHELAAGLVTRRRRLALDDQRLELGPGRVEGGGQAGGPAAHDDDLAMLRNRGHVRPRVGGRGASRGRRRRR